MNYFLRCTLITTGFISALSSVAPAARAGYTPVYADLDKPVYLDPSQPIDARVEDVLARMSLDEKISLIHGDSKFTTPAIPRLGIPQRWLSDGPHGVRDQVSKDSWNAAGHTDDYSTWLPVSLALAATWDPNLAHLYGQTIGEEARKRGKQIMLGPSVNIQRTPLCGRNFEYMGEDPLLTSRMAVQYIRGEQSQGISACVKHFAANNQEDHRFIINVEMDERTLREIYLPAFKAAVQEGDVWSVMGAYNLFRGQHCCENKYLLNELLKKEWNFHGLVVSDWNGAHNTREAAMNGLDLEMGTEKKSYDDYYLARPFAELIRRGEIPMSVLDDKVRRNLRVMFATHMFDDLAAWDNAGSINTPQHQAAARKIAEEGIVLLKNKQNLLPLSTGNIKSIAVIGENATRKFSYSGGSAKVKALYEITTLEGLLDRAGSAVDLNYSIGYSSKGTTDDMIARAADTAAQSDVVILIAGLSHDKYHDEEGTDRKDMRLPYRQDELIQQVVKVNPRTAVVLVDGGAVEMDPWIDTVPAIVQAWYPGMEGGTAIASVLFGDVNPSGKLPFTFPRKLTDSPAHADNDPNSYPGQNNIVHYSEGLLVGYRWFDTKKIEPLFPFGHGLSYTTFAYSNLKLTPGSGPTGPVLTATADITNTGSRAGAEVVQLYIHQQNPTLPRPEKELKGFAKISLKPSETASISIPLNRDAFSFYNPNKKAWVAEKDSFDILLGSSSRDIRLTTHWSLDKTTAQ
jgi:beta-glucosidase